MFSLIGPFIWIILFKRSAFEYVRNPVVNILSGGATFPLDVYKIWRPMYVSERSAYADIVMNYEAVGSGEGIERFNKRLYDFAGSDIVIPDSSYTNSSEGDIQMFPTMAGPISISYNIPEIPTVCSSQMSECLNLSREAITGIFNGSIRNWNDPIIVQHNEALRDINVSITVLVRTDSSGTTQLFTSALSVFSSHWKRTYGIFSQGCTDKGEPIKWNSTLNIKCGATSFGVVGLLLTHPYSIGYCVTSEARDSALPEARLLNQGNHWVNPSVKSVQAAMDSFASDLGPRLTRSLVDSPASDAYPIAGYTYFLIRKKSMTNCTVAQEILRFFLFVLTNNLAQSIVRDLIKAPISDRVFALINTQVFEKMECGGKKVTELMRVAIAIETGAYDAWKIPVAVCMSIVFIALVAVGCSLAYMQYLKNGNVLKGTYIIQTDIAELIKQSTGSLSISTPAEGHVDYQHESQVARITSGEKCLVRPLCEHLDAETLRWNTRKLLVQMKHELQHSNVVKILGITKWGNDWKVITSWPKKGRIKDVIHAGKYSLNSDVRYSIVSDIAEGMAYLHKNEIIHGQLTTHNCYIDSRWNGQVGDWEKNVLHNAQKVRFVAFESMYNSVHNSYPTAIDSLNEYCQLLYSSPSEVLEQDDKQLFLATSVSKPADVYSFIIVAYEVFSGLRPFENLTLYESSKWQPLNILTAIKSGDIRPNISDNLRVEFPLTVKLIQTCWNAEPTDRPTFLQIAKMLKLANPKSTSVIDTMMQTVENYAVSLEEKVLERTTELEKLTQNMKALLYNMLPSSTADKLSRGEQVEPELYESVTLCFTDIVGFTSLAALSLPIQIVDLLNDLYTTFDSVINNYDVYKVETIGDSYMCISGLPHRNGLIHASDIATMALDMLNVSPTIPIRHMPGTVLQVRAGVHSGSVMAGVVGLKMPRYCLFGDTVNTAARMESSSLPMRIQISEDTKTILDVFNIYEVHLRGRKEIKGKGLMTTYWLTGKQGYRKELPVFNPNDDEQLRMMLDESQIK